MKASEAGSTGALGRALVETLQSLAEPSVARGLVEVELRREGLVAVPEDVGDFREFVEGPVYGSVVQHLGEQAGDSMIDQLRPTIEMASVHADARESAVTIAAPAKAARGPLPAVLLMSYDEHSAAAVAEELDGRAHVRMVEMTMQLMSAVETAARPPILVIDDGATTLDAETVEWVGSLVETMPQVVLWGVDEHRLASVLRSAPSAERWARVEQRCTAQLINRLHGILDRA